MKFQRLIGPVLLAMMGLGAVACQSDSGPVQADQPKTGSGAKAAPAPAAPARDSLFFAVKSGGEIPATMSPDKDADAAETLFPGACLKALGPSDDGLYKSVETLDGITGLWVADRALVESPDCGSLFALRDELYNTMKSEWDTFAANYADYPAALHAPAAFHDWLTERMPDPVTEDILCWNADDEYIDGPSASMSGPEAVDMLAGYLESASPAMDPDKPPLTPEQLFYQTAIIEPGVTGMTATITLITQGGDCIPSMALSRGHGDWKITGLKRTCMTYCTVFGEY